MESMKASFHQDLTTLQKEKKLDENLWKSETKNLLHQISKLRQQMESAGKSIQVQLKSTLENMKAILEQQKIQNSSSPLIQKFAQDVKVMLSTLNELKTVMNIGDPPPSSELLSRLAKRDQNV